MKNITLLPADSYTVISKSILTGGDRKNLIALYEPIIGPIAVSLYLTLWNDLDKLEIMSLEYNHHHLMSIMKLDLTSLKVARETLESVGLIKTLYKEGNVNSYIYELYAPLSPKEFFTHPIFNVVLYNNIGKVEYDRLKVMYQSINYNFDDYIDITSTLDNTFKSSYIIPEFDIRERQTSNIKLEKSIDFDMVLSSIPSNILNEKSLNKKVRELINNLAFVYNLDTLKMIEVIRSSINSNGYIITTDLRRKARDYYTFQNNGKLPTLIYRTQPEYLKEPIGDTSKRAKIIYVFENTTPYDFLKSKYKGSNPTSRDLKLIESLLCDLELKPAVVNVLIDYVLRKNNNKLNQAFVETIAGQWKRCNVQTARDAMNLAEKENKKIVKSSPKNIKNIEAKPVWFKDEIKKEEASEDEIKELEELMKGYRQ